MDECLKNICPVCGFDNLHEPPYDKDGFGSYEICPKCGFEFGCDDFPDKEKAFLLWKNKWLDGGSKWFSTVRKPDKK